ncbi:MAG: hypothetical protein M3220_22390, partial [Chloroflexota bacterium]|nr:hypothetical protein [Chloroflexota bacterium]
KQNGEVRITLHWQAMQDDLPLTQRFLHLVPAQGTPIPLAQVDTPLGQEYPSTQWTAGEWVSETITLSIPSDAPPRLRLLVGLYNPATSERLPVAPNTVDEAFELGTFRSDESGLQFTLTDLGLR